MNGVLRWMGLSLVLGASVVSGATVAPSWTHPPHQQTEGIFWREHWYERGSTNGNAGYTSRLRINSPEAVRGPFGNRSEARENGLMIIRAEEDLFQVTGAELYVELWGGHPGTADKRVTVNGRSTIQIPKVGTEDGHCTFSYPVLPLRIDDLVNGYNAFQWALEQGTTFWGHAMVDQACVRVALTNGHSELTGLTAFVARVRGRSYQEGSRDGWKIALEVPGRFLEGIERVDYQGWYSGYDEDGDLRGTGWHGFTLNREPVALIGSATTPPFGIAWDTSLLPAQKNVAVRALVRFRDAPGLVYVTSARTGWAVPDRKGEAVHLYQPVDLPASFWSRAGRSESCSIELDVDPARIERAELYVKSWTGGAGEVKEYFKLNGHHFPVAEGQGHRVQNNRLAVDPAILRRGKNRVELLSDTTHHGIEIIYPGPALMVRYRLE